MADITIQVTIREADIAELIEAGHFVFGEKSDGVPYTNSELMEKVKGEWIKLLRGYVMRYRSYLREQNSAIEESIIGE